MNIHRRTTLLRTCCVAGGGGWMRNFRHLLCEKIAIKKFWININAQRMKPNARQRNNANENCWLFFTFELRNVIASCKRWDFSNQILSSYNRKSFQSNEHKKVTNQVLTDVNLHLNRRKTVYLYSIHSMYGAHGLSSPLEASVRILKINGINHVSAFIKRWKLLEPSSHWSMPKKETFENRNESNRIGLAGVHLSHFALIPVKCEKTFWHSPYQNVFIINAFLSVLCLHGISNCKSSNRIQLYTQCVSF